jgi:FKBP-type peptidyl-prolyl cis-trans isomerase
MRSRVAEKSDKQSEGVDISGDGGLLKIILVQGKIGEEIPLNVTAMVHYTGKLLDGTVFDSSGKMFIYLYICKYIYIYICVFTYVYVYT